MPLKLVMPAARSSAMIGARSAARLLGRAWTASQPAWRAAGVIRCLASYCTGREDTKGAIKIAGRQLQLFIVRATRVGGRSWPVSAEGQTAAFYTRRRAFTRRLSAGSRESREIVGLNASPPLPRGDRLLARSVRGRALGARSAAPSGYNPNQLISSDTLFLPCRKPSVLHRRICAVRNQTGPHMV
jgi:hypothetical protein